MEEQATRGSSGRWWIVVVLLFAAACAGDSGGDAGDELPVTLPLAERALDDPDVTTVATDLAPSQTGGATVPEPPTPDPCRAVDVEMWTAQVGADGSTAVIRMRNAGERWCEPDIGRSPRLDPAIEPDVWLLPDATADLVVGESTSGCADPVIVDRVQVGIGDESVLVPTALLTCGWWLAAFYPNDGVRQACEPADLDVAIAAASVVVRNASATPCGLSGLAAVDGAEVAATVTTEPAVHELLPGDVVSFGRRGDEPCDGVHERVVLHDDEVGEIELSHVPCVIVFELGAPRPWFGPEAGPLVDLPDGTSDATTVIDLLDPFDDDE